MNDFNIRITHREGDTEQTLAIDCVSSTKSSVFLVEGKRMAAAVNSAISATDASDNPEQLVEAEPFEMQQALTSISQELRCDNTLDDMLHAIDALRAKPVSLTPIKIAADGTHLPAGYAGTDHVAVLFPDTGTIYYAHSLGDAAGDPMPHRECEAACEKLDVLGLKWQLASREEAIRLVKDDRSDPAVDSNLFPGIKPRWHWTRTALAGSPSLAWGVHFGLGYVHHGYHRDSRGFALAVARAGQ